MEEIIITVQQPQHSIDLKNDQSCLDKSVEYCESKIIGNSSTKEINKIDIEENTHQNNVLKQMNKSTYTIEISNDIDLLLIGKTGKGKSALGNSLLARTAFKSNADVSSVTDDIQTEEGTFNGRVLKVVDTPGVCDTRMSEEDSIKVVSKKMNDAIQLNPDGYHAFIYVLKFGERFTEEDVTALQIFKQIFGYDFVNKFCVLVLTCGDNFEKQVTNKNGKTFREWCTEQQGVFKQLLEECEGRVVLFDNLTEENEKLQKQKTDLIIVIDRLQSTGKRYNVKYFDRAKETRDKLLIGCKIPALKDKILKEIDIFMSCYNQIKFIDHENDLKELRKMQQRSTNLLAEISEEYKDSEPLGCLLESVRLANRTIEKEIKACEREKSLKGQILLKQQEIWENKCKQILLEEKNRNYEKCLLQKEFNMKANDILESKTKDDKDMFIKSMKRQNEKEELKIKNLEMKANQKQEQNLKEFEDRKNQLESEKKRFYEEMELQKHLDHEKLQLLQDAITVCLSVCMSQCLTVFLSVFLSIFLSFVCFFICITIGSSIRLLVWLSVGLTVCFLNQFYACLSVNVPVCIPVVLPGYLSVYLFLCLIVCQSNYLVSVWETVRLFIISLPVYFFLAVWKRFS